MSDLIAHFSGDMSTIPALLDVLIVLPEEVRQRERERICVCISLCEGVNECQGLLDKYTCIRND